MQVLLKDFGVWGSLGFARWTFQCWLLLALDRMWACLRACEPGGTHRGLLQRAGGRTDTAFPSKPEKGGGGVGNLR